MSDAWMFPNVPGMGASPWFSTGTSGLSSAQQQYNQNQAYYAQQAAAQQAAQVQQSQLYGGGSFGAQPAYYAGVGAAYGRATGGFGGYGAAQPAADPWNPYAAMLTQQAYQPVSDPWGGMGSVFNQGTTPYNNYNGEGVMGSFSPSPNYSGGGYNGSDTLATMLRQYGIGAGVGGGSAAPAYTPPTPQPSFNQMWGNTPWTTGSNYPALDLMRSFNGVGTGVAPYSVPPSPPPTAAEMGFPGGITSSNWRQAYDTANAAALGQSAPQLPDMQRLLGYNPATSAQWAPQQSPSPFFGAFSQFPNAGTPSQYYTGNQYGGGQYGLSGMLPPGFATPFSADNPGGAIPVGGFRMDQQ